MQRISRRKFIADAATLAALYPLVSSLESCGSSSLSQEDFAKGIRYIDSNGANLSLYFINSVQDGKYLRPEKITDLNSYLIVQIPPQSLHEEHSREFPTSQVHAKIARSSFLAFKLWPNNKDSKRKIEFVIDKLMDWENEEYFELLTTSSLDNRALRSFNQLEDVSQSIVVDDPLSPKFGLAYYNMLMDTLLISGKQKYFTIFELPAELLLAPRTNKATKIRVVHNTFLKPEVVSITKNGVKFQRGIEPRWSAELRYEEGVNERGIPIEVPATLRAIGLRLPLKKEPSFGRDLSQCPDKDNNYLPSLLDEMELIFLNQIYHQHYGDKSYDIKLDTSFRLTSLGASLKFSYKNLLTRDTRISLVGYEHHFQDGRDNYIKVSRIGVIAPNGNKKIHVKIAYRTVEHGISYMKYEERIEDLEPEKQLASSQEELEAKVNFDSMFQDTPSDANPEGSEFQKTFYHRYPFTKALTPEKKSFVIRPVSNPCSTYFWVYRDGTTGDDAKNLLPMPFTYTDRIGNKIDAEHPVLFLRKDFFTDKPSIDEFINGHDPLRSALGKTDDGRLRISFKNNVIAFTKDDDKIDPNESGTRNSINHVPTEYLEWYFNIAKPKVPGEDIFETAPFVIYPQMYRSKGYFDHIQQGSADRLPSLFEYPMDFLKHEFSDGNKAKIVLKHTNQFIEGKLTSVTGGTCAIDTSLNDGYEKIKNVFNNAGDKIGGLVNPDINIERFALVKEALTLPKDINNQWNSLTAGVDRQLKTIDILKGKSAEILGGIDLKMLLEEVMGTENSPQFVLNKIAAEIDNIDAFVNEFKNSTVLKVIKIIQDLNKTILEVKKEVDLIKNEIETKVAEIQALKDRLQNLVPDITKIKNGAKILFEQQRLAFIGQVKDATKTVEILIKNQVLAELAQVLPDMGTNFMGPVNKVTEFVKSIDNNINEVKSATQYLPDDVREMANEIIRQIDGEGRAIVTELSQHLKPILDGTFSETPSFPSIKLNINNDIEVFLVNGVYSFSSASPDAKRVAWSEILWHTISTSTSEVRALILQIQNLGVSQLEDVSVWLKAIQYSNATEIQSIVTEINRKRDKLDAALLGKATAVTDAISRKYHQFVSVLPKYKQFVDDTLFWMNIVQKCSADHYFKRLGDVVRDYNDIRNKIGLVVLPDLSNLQDHPIAKAAVAYHKQIEEVYKAIRDDKENVSELLKSLNTLLLNADAKVEKLVASHIEELSDEQPWKDALEAYKAITTNAYLETTAKQKLEQALTKYKGLIEIEGRSKLDQLRIEFEKELQLLDNSQIRAAKEEFDKLMKLYQSVRRQELNYTWSTDKFKTVNIGILRFTPHTNPKTKLNVSVKSVIHLDPLKFPSVIERVESKAENTITNFDLTFLNSLTVGFNEIRFVVGTGTAPKLSVKIRDVKFDGALSFIQKLEELLKSLGEGFKIELAGNAVMISYNMPVPGISSPGFTFTNFSIGVGLNIYFDRQPMSLTLLLARADSKAIIAAGILGGGFHCALTVEPKRGIRSIEMAIEMGAYLGISIGPIRGEVKIMVGLFYRRDDFGVIMEGYIVAEGTLSVWIISVSARIYLAVRSQNSYVEGSCTVTYTAKVGFIKKSFSGTFRKKIAGAESQRSQSGTAQTLSLRSNQSIKRSEFLFAKFQQGDDVNESGLVDHLFTDEYQVMKKDEWIEFYKYFYE